MKRLYKSFLDATKIKFKTRQQKEIMDCLQKEHESKDFRARLKGTSLHQYQVTSN